MEWAATVAIANITVLLIHLSAATIGEDEDDQVDSRMVRPEEFYEGMAGSRRGEVRPRGNQYAGVSLLHQSGGQPNRDGSGPQSVEVQPEHAGRNI